MRSGTLALLLTPVFMGGCAMGPRALERTHGRYLDAVRLVEAEQLLGNVVRVRYGEAPLALNINSVTAQFEFSAGAEARPFFSTEASGDQFRAFSTVLPFAQAGAASRPTFSFDPADDGTATRQFLTPISEEVLVLLLRTEPRVDMVLRLWVERINGLPAGPEFRQAAALFQAAKEKGLITVQPDERDVEASGPVPASAMTASSAVEAARDGLRYQPTPDGKAWALVRRVRGLSLQVVPGAEAAPELAELCRLLGLVPGLTRYPLRLIEPAIPDPARGTGLTDKVSLTPRSTALVYRYLSGGVVVPPSHQAQGVTLPPDSTDPPEGVFTVHTCKGCRPPPEAFIAVPYRGHWYYIDDRDVESKATLALIMQLGRLDFKRQTIGPTPVLTLPVGK
jgi:hypothetical protein